LLPCLEQSNEHDVDDFPTDSNSVIQSSSNSQLALKVSEDSTSIKYISFSEKLDVSNSLNDRQSQDDESTSSCSSQIKLATSKNAQNISRSQSRPFFVFTNKPLKGNVLNTQEANFGIQGSKIASAPLKTNPSKISNLTVITKNDADFASLEIAAQLATNAIECALAELRYD